MAKKINIIHLCSVVLLLYLNENLDKNVAAEYLMNQLLASYKSTALLGGKSDEQIMKSYQAIGPEALKMGKIAGELWLSGFSMINGGFNVAYTASELMDGKGAEAMLNILPFLHTGTKFFLKGGEQLTYNSGKWLNNAGKVVELNWKGAYSKLVDMPATQDMIKLYQTEAKAMGIEVKVGAFENKTVNNLIHINPNGASVWLLADEFCHAFGNTAGKGEWLTGKLRTMHEGFVKRIKDAGTSGILSKPDQDLYHQLEILNMFNSGKKLPSILEANRSQLLKYTEALINHK